MSSRQLRKFQKQRELEAALEKTTQQDEKNVEESDDEEPIIAVRPKPNLFAALVGQDDDVDADEADDDEAGPVDEPMASVPKSVSSAKKSKKKKKKKKSQKKAVVAADDEKNDNDAAVGDDDGSEDEIDRAIKALKIDDAGRRYSVSKREEKQRRVAASNSLLQINSHNLKAVNEMRSLFGRDVIESATAEEEQQQQGRRGRRRQMPQQVDLESFLRMQGPNARKLPEVSLRRNVFIQGREYWPAQSAGGLTMKEVARAEDGAWTEYAYVHEGEYDELQMLFFACVQLGDPMRMVHLLKRVPYHVSTLLQVSFVAKQDQNMALSSELCERALFTFGRVTTSAFRRNMEQGKARLDFRRPENRQFWLAGYHYLRSLVRKGTFRTALEWAKLMYALDPQDPYAMRHYIHFLAVRAYESQWLVEFLQDAQQTPASAAHEDWKYVRQTAVLAHLQLGETEKAEAALGEGIRQLPWLYCALFRALGLDALPSVWGAHAESEGGGARPFWVRLYLHFAKDLWNNTQATGLLRQVARGVEKAEVSTDGEADDDREADLGAARLAYLEGETGLIGLAPRALLESQPNYEFDPLPPPEADNVFTRQGTRLPWTTRRGGGGNDEGVNEALARMQHLMAIQAAADGNGGGGGVRGFGVAGGGEEFGGEFDETEEEETEEEEEEEVTDEELRRDLEEEARRRRGPGLVARLMGLLGGVVAGDGVRVENFEDGGGEEEEEEGEGEGEGLI